MASSGRLIASILAVVALAIAFWVLLLSPQREQADKLGGEVQQLTAAVETARGEVAEATEAKREFPTDYRQLVALGQAAPAGDETASLLAELELIASSSGVTFTSLQLNSSSSEAAVPETPAPSVPAPEGSSSASPGAVQASATVPPTELAASLSPLGASIGPAGLYVMPYDLEFTGDFFQITNFIQKVDALVTPGAKGVEVDGRLITIGGFSLQSETEGGGAELSATLSVTTYLTPPSQGLTLGATPSAPAPATAEPATSAPAPGSSGATSETVSAR